MDDKILVTKPSIPPFEEYVNEIKDIWDRDWLTNFGPKHEEFREQLERFMDTNELCLTVNGHQALYAAIAILANKAEENSGEIITTPFTFASTTHAIAQNGFKPVFCDIDPITYTMDPSLIEALITENTKAIVPVHVYGNVCETEKIEAIGKKYNIPVIYDAAHAFAIKVNGKGIANFGDASIFSFHATKAFNSIEGGAVSVRDHETFLKIKQFINFGLIDSENVLETGTNAKMNEFSAAMGILNLRHIDEILAGRKRVTERYINNLASDALDNKTGLDKKLGIKFLPEQDGVTRNYAYFPVLFSPCDSAKVSAFEVKSVLESEGILSRRYFHPLTSDFECYKNMPGAGKTKTAKYISDNILALPMYAELKDEDIDRICALIKPLL